MKIPLPKEVETIFEAANQLGQRYPGRKFTPDGHLVGSIGEVIAAEAFNLELLPNGAIGHDAKDIDDNLVQIKLTGGTSVTMNAICQKLLIMKIVSTAEARLVYFGSGEVAWTLAAPFQKNGYRRLALSKLRNLKGWILDE